jgi:hypothetical protein
MRAARNIHKLTLEYHLLALRLGSFKKSFQAG